MSSNSRQSEAALLATYRFQYKIHETALELSDSIMRVIFSLFATCCSGQPWMFNLFIQRSFHTCKTNECLTRIAHFSWWISFSPPLLTFRKSIHILHSELSFTFGPLDYPLNYPLNLFLQTTARSPTTRLIELFWWSFLIESSRKVQPGTRLGAWWSWKFQPEIRFLAKITGRKVKKVFNLYG